MRHGEQMIEYLDELIHLFRKARPGAFIQFQEEEVKNRSMVYLLKLCLKYKVTWT